MGPCHFVPVGPFVGRLSKFSHQRGRANITSSVATDATAMYAKNLLNFITLSVDKDKGALVFDGEDQIIAETRLTHDGKVVHPKFGGEEVANG